MAAADAILAVLAQRGAEGGTGKTICPSEAARRIGGDRWREAMPAIHAAASALSQERRVRLTQRGVDVAGPPAGAYRIAAVSE